MIKRQVLEREIRVAAAGRAMDREVYRWLGFGSEKNRDAQYRSVRSAMRFDEKPGYGEPRFFGTTLPVAINNADYLPDPDIGQRN